MRGGTEAGLLLKVERLEEDVALFFERESFGRGHQKRGTDDLWLRERMDCSREPWKRPTESVSNLIPIHFLV
jgi:hypothetical protein